MNEELTPDGRHYKNAQPTGFVFVEYILRASVASESDRPIYVRVPASQYAAEDGGNK